MAFRIKRKTINKKCIISLYNLIRLLTIIIDFPLIINILWVFYRGVITQIIISLISSLGIVPDSDLQSRGCWFDTRRGYINNVGLFRHNDNGLPFIRNIIQHSETFSIQYNLLKSLGSHVSIKKYLT